MRRLVAVLVALFAACQSEELASHYFDMLDRDNSGSLDLAEIQFFVTNMIQLSGFGSDGDTVNLDDKDTAVDGKTLRQLIQHTFDAIDANDDGSIHVHEALKAQTLISKVLGDFMATNMPNEEF
eukprot:CAMPEP_0198647494 /NCGR_PEP_ID=MMETSP1467-20131203/2770_1 /TAXON_ID=1462469 /ORGANISM="unid. sp., Strain CCMP2135" /LENGTH=123 /DNA_ID=CAMNT_0044383127 /DNA_START=232 /DNA_END=603 /DNA_ORIENTATION=+